MSCKWIYSVNQAKILIQEENIQFLSIMSSSFGDLLQQAEQLTADMDSGWELPRVERNLHQLAEAGQRLWSQTTGAAGDNAQVKA